MGWGNENVFKWSRSHVKMAVMPIYGKTIKKSSSLEPKGRWPWKLICNIEYSSTTKFIQTMPLGWRWPILRQGQIWSPMLLYVEKVKTMDFSETIVVHHIKVGRCSQLNEYMKLYEYQRSRSFIDLGPNHSDSIFLNFFSSITTYFNISSALRWAIQDQWSSGIVNGPTIESSAVMVLYVFCMFLVSLYLYGLLLCRLRVAGAL